MSQAVFVTERPVGRRVGLDLEGDPFRVGGRTDHLNSALDDVKKIDRARFDLEFAGDDARQVDQVVDQLRLRLCVAQHGLQSMPGVPFDSRFPQQQVRPSDNRVERRAELVREDREELVLHPTRLGVRGALLQKPIALRFGTLPRGDVADRADRHDAILDFERAQADFDGEFRAVFAKAK